MLSPSGGLQAGYRFVRAQCHAQKHELLCIAPYGCPAFCDPQWFGPQRKLFLMHEGSMPDRGEDGVAYTAYQLGNFLGLLQIVYELSPSMSFGHPGRDCIRRNLLQSVEDAFAWDVEDLHKVRPRAAAAAEIRETCPY